MKKTVRSLVATLLLAATLWAVPHTANAATNAAVNTSPNPASPATKILTITPATTKPTVKPGESVQGSFQVINQGTGDYPVLIYAAPYTVHSEDYTPDFTPVRGKLNAANWLEFAASKADIAANQTLDVKYTITVPTGTKPGGYYAVAFAETQSPRSGQGVVVNERVGEIFYIQVAGKATQSGKLVTWSSKFLQQQPLTATLRLQNEGSLDYASDIHVVVRDLFGRPKYALSTTKEVLPQTIRRIPISWDGTPVLGLFKVTGTVTVAGKAQALSTHYVLVASPVVRLIGLGLVAACIAFGAGKKIGRYRRQAKAKAA